MKKISYLFCVGLVILFVFVASSCASDYMSKSEFYEYTKVLAEQGDSEAQYILGLMYYYGDGIAQDYREAVNWYRKAAEQEHIKAQIDLGVIYAAGAGFGRVAQDQQEAVKWIRKAAEQGNAQAQDILGYRYRKGKGVARDYREAIKWYRKSASK